MPKHQQFHLPMQFLAITFVIFAIHGPKHHNRRPASPQPSRNESQAGQVRAALRRAPGTLQALPSCAFMSLVVPAILRAFVCLLVQGVLRALRETLAFFVVKSPSLCLCGGSTSSTTLSQSMRTLLTCSFLLLSTLASAQQYDLVLEGGRVMDPETNLDAIRNVAILNGKIARISADLLPAKRTIPVKGLVVAPGFIDLHQHGQDLGSQRVKAFDGVTTALELEIGTPDVADFLKAKQDHSLIHYGTAASHPAARAFVFGAPLPSESLKPH